MRKTIGSNPAAVDEAETVVGFLVSYRKSMDEKRNSTRVSLVAIRAWMKAQFNNGLESPLDMIREEQLQLTANYIPTIPSDLVSAKCAIL